MAAPSISIEELRSFHSIDRQLYRRLVVNLRHNIFQIMHMIGLWLWLEEIGYPNIVLKMLTLPDSVVNQIVDDAIRCINCLHSETPPPYLSPNIATEIPITQSLMEGLPISLSILYQNRLCALSRIARTVVDVGLRAFDDIAGEALLLSPNANNNNNSDNNHGNRDHQQEHVNNQGIGSQPTAMRPMTSNGSGNVVHQRLIGSSPSGLIRPIYQAQHPLIYGTPFGLLPRPVPAAVLGGGAPHRLPQIIGHMGQPHGAAGELVLLPRAFLHGQSSITEIGESSNQASYLNPMAQPWGPNDTNEQNPQSERTMFITFSRGYPITERELRNFFVSLYGNDCIEELYMQEVPADKQSLFARIVFDSVRTTAAILDGKEKAKFSINGKHVWVRLYVEKQNQPEVP